MKKFFYLALVAVLMTACAQSLEQKAEALIKESLKKSLYKPETYKPVETKVDSAFAPYDDPKFFAELVEFGKTNSEYENLEFKAKQAKSSMSIWSGPYQTAFGKNQYEEAKAEYEEASAEIEKIMKKGKKQFDRIVRMVKESRKFIGYKAVHNYRAENNAGNNLIGNTIFFINKDFKEITCSMEVEEYNKVQEDINDFIEQLEENSK